MLPRDKNVSMECRIILIGASLVCIFSVLFRLFGIENQTQNEFTYPENKTLLPEIKCLNGHFILKTMTTCHKWLSCNDIEMSVKVLDNTSIGEGAVKKVFRGSWEDHDVAVSYLKDMALLPDFEHNIMMLQQLIPRPSASQPWLAQLLGWCTEGASPVMVTELHPWGTADGVHDILRSLSPDQNTLETRFRLCVEFVKILVILHDQKDGSRVLCDANQPNKALSQFLLSSDSLSLVLNDVDALPLVNKSSGDLIKCGHRELVGEFVAPEQTWPYEDLPFDDSVMPGYDEKVDVWKIPDVCYELIGDCAGSASLKLHLFNVHMNCKLEAPSERWTARQVLDRYLNVSKKNLHNKCL